MSVGRSGLSLVEIGGRIVTRPLKIDESWARIASGGKPGDHGDACCARLPANSVPAAPNIKEPELPDK
jgi:hypothetical protein